MTFCLSIFSLFAPNLTKPNVLFIDDLKPILSCYGESQMMTPNNDRLAKMRIFFLNNYSHQSVCAPTPASLLTGQRPDYTRILDLKTQIRDMRLNVVNLPQYFKENGYTTATIGKMFDQRSVDKMMGYTIRPKRYRYVAWYELELNYRNTIIRSNQNLLPWNSMIIKNTL